MSVSEISREKGIIGCGGAGFPLHVKLRGKARYYVVNCAECEPLLYADKHLISHNFPEVARGLQIAMAEVGAEEGFVAIKKKYSHLIRREHLPENVRVVELDDFYPAGDEVVLVQEVLGKTVPQRGIPLDVECVVNNPETLYNLYLAVEEGRPVVDKFFSVHWESGCAVVSAPVGTEVSFVLKELSVPTKDRVIYMNGPMMGFKGEENSVVDKTTSGIILLPPDSPVLKEPNPETEFFRKRIAASCLQCRQCTDYCPRYLLGHEIQPHLVMRNYLFSRTPTPSSALCSECGLCYLVCPAGLSPRNLNRKLKSMLKDLPEKRTSAPHPSRSVRKVPSERVIRRLRLSNLNLPPKEFKRLEPNSVRVPLKQGFSRKVTPTVKPGDSVHRGDVVGKPEDSLSTFLHAPLDGTVTAVTEEEVIIEKR